MDNNITSNDFVQRELKKQEDIKKILKDDYYIGWVEYFMAGRDILYCYEFEESEYLKKDIENIDLIPAFFQAIENYAKENYIYPTNAKYGYYYSIRYKSNGFDVGVTTGQGIDYYIAQPLSNDIYNFIDFEDILNNKKTDNCLNIKQEIINSYEDNVPIEAIEEVADDTIKKLKKKHS